MWNLRASIFRLKECPPLDEQRVVFERRVRSGQRNLLARDEDGRLRGITSMHWRVSPDGREVWVLPEYAFLDRNYRGSPQVATGLLTELGRLLVYARGRPLWFAGIGYPRSYQTLGRVTERVWTLADPDLAADAGRVLLYLHEVFARDTWDRRTHRVALPTIPEPRPDRPRSRHWRRFEELCPSWQEGYGLGMAARIRPQTLLRLVADALTRRGRRRDRDE